MTDFPWLFVVGGIPLAGALLVALTPKVNATWTRWVALAVSLLTLVAALGMAAAFDTGSGERFQFEQVYTWIEQFGIHVAVGVDGIALVLILLTAFLVPVVVVASWRDADRGPGAAGFFGWMLLLEAMLIGVFAATDLFFFYVFFEAMLVPMYFLIGRYGAGGTRASYAAVKFLLYSLVGGLVMLAGVVALYAYTATGDGPPSFLFADLQGAQLAAGVSFWIWFSFFIAFAIKAPLWPFHTWLPDAAAQAPVGATILLVGVMDKVGTFGFLRWSLPLFPETSRDWAPLVMVLAVIGIFYGALLAVGQRDLKRLLAYTSVAHFGFIALGIFAFTSQAMTGSTLYMVNHGFSTGLLFLVVGFLLARQGSSAVSDFGGVHKVAPWLSGAFFIGGLSSLALPGTNSFVSEFLVLIGTFPTNRVFAIIATVGIVLAALYILLMYQRTMHGPLLERNAGMRDLSWREAAAVVPMVAVILWLGVYPKPAIDVIEPAVVTTQDEVGVDDPPPVHTPAQAGADAAEGADH